MCLFLVWLIRWFFQNWLVFDNEYRITLFISNFWFCKWNKISSNYAIDPFFAPARSSKRFQFQYVLRSSPLSQHSGYSSCTKLGKRFWGYFSVIRLRCIRFFPGYCQVQGSHKYLPLSCFKKSFLRHIQSQMMLHPALKNELWFFAEGKLSCILRRNR